MVMKFNVSSQESWPLFLTRRKDEGSSVFPMLSVLHWGSFPHKRAASGSKKAPFIPHMKVCIQIWKNAC